MKAPRSSALAEGIERLPFDALGGDVELFAIGPGEPLDETAEWIRGLHRRLTRFEADSELSRFNARAGQWATVSADLEQLLRASLKAFEESHGLVHVGVLPALIVAGYDRTFEQVNGRGSSPSTHASPEERSGALAPLPDLLKVRPGEAHLARGAAIDLGGIAKGWIADRAVERLGPNSLVSCGGDLFARGGGETGDGWPVGFGPRTVLLKDMGAATSGTTKRRWGDGLHHLIDPRTGAPSNGDLGEVSVLAATALHAEVLAKTALLLGSERAEAYLEPRARGWVLS